LNRKSRPEPLVLLASLVVCLAASGVGAGGIEKAFRARDTRRARVRSQGERG
jgi:hypothetical protein